MEILDVVWGLVDLIRGLPTFELAVAGGALGLFSLGWLVKRRTPLKLDPVLGALDTEPEPPLGDRADRLADVVEALD